MAVLVDLNGTSIQECSEALFLSTALEDLTDTTTRATATAATTTIIMITTIRATIMTILIIMVQQ